MEPTLKLFEVLEGVISFETFPRTHGRLISAGLTTEVKKFCLYNNVIQKLVIEK
jgi:hypothetical protein